MATLNTQPSERTNGQSLGRKEAGMSIRTNNNLATIEPEAPAYSDDTQRRISAALSRAEASTRHAEYLGANKVFGYELYKVKSTDSKKVAPYHVRVYPAGSTILNAFAYLAPWNKVLCECQGAQNGAPCDHSALVARRLARDSKRRGQIGQTVSDIEATIARHERLAFSDAPDIRQDVPTEVPKPARKERGYTLESLFEDVA